MSNDTLEAQERAVEALINHSGRRLTAGLTPDNAPTIEVLDLDCNLDNPDSMVLATFDLRD